MKKLFILITVLFCSTLIFAQENSTPRFALVIGNQTYKESPLKNPVPDAQLMRNALQKCGFDVTFATDLDQTQLQNKIAEYAEKVETAGKKSISFFYYSGHGVQIDGINYMVPIDDKGITSEVKAKGKCYSISQVFELVPSETQIVVLDACRNNPFTSSKVKFQKGLSRIANPKGVKNFMAFFSTSDGATAADGTGKNSVFTEKLAFHVENDFNTPISTIFNSVANDVKTASKGMQTPLVTGTGVNFELMNAEIARLRIKALEESSKPASGKKTGDVKVYDSDKKLVQAEIDLLKARKEAAEKDAKIKAAENKKNKEAQKRNIEELKKLQADDEKMKRIYQKNKGIEKKSYDFVTEIEDNKEALQKIRQNAADKIYSADNSTQKNTDNKIDKVNNRELKISEKDANGKPNSQTIKKRKEEIKLLNAENDAEKKKNYETFYEKIIEEETDRKQRLDADLKTLSGAVYTAGSIDKEVHFETSTYDGEKNQWIVSATVDLFGKKNIFKVEIPLTYQQLCVKILEKKYVPPAKLMGDSYDQYNDDVETYHKLFTSEKNPVVVEFDYKVAPSSGNSVYKISAVCARVLLLKNGELVQLNEVKASGSEKLVWEKKQTELKTVSDILKSYHKRDAAEKKEAEKKEKAAKAAASGDKPKNKLFGLFSN